MQRGAPHFVFISAVLMSLRVNTVFALSLDEFEAAIIRGSPSCVLDVLVHVTSIFVEVVLFRLGAHWLGRAVSVMIHPHFSLPLQLSLSPCQQHQHQHQHQYQQHRQHAQSRQ